MDITKAISEEFELDEKKILVALSETFDSIYYVNIVDDSYVEIAPNRRLGERLNLNISGSHFFDDVKLNLARVGYPDDIDMVLEFINKDRLIEALKSGATNSSEYRLLIDGEPVYFRMRVSMSKTDSDYILIAVENVNEATSEKLRQQAILKRDHQIIEVLASEYDSVYYLDLQTGKYETYTLNRNFKNGRNAYISENDDFKSAYVRFVNTIVYEADKSMMLKFTDREYINRELENVRSKDYMFRVFENGQIRYSEMKIVRFGEAGNKPTAVAVGFADKDKEIRAEKERRRIKERDLAVIAGLADDFECVVYVDMQSMRENHYRFNPSLLENIVGWSQIDDFNVRLNNLVNTIMHPDDRKQFHKVTSMSSIETALEEKPTYYVNFRVLLDDEITYYQLKFVKDEKAGNHFVAGFRNVDSETRKELEALDQAQAASRAKTIFLNNMSHDIRTPMNAIMGYTDMAIKNADNMVKVLDCLRKSKESSEHLLSLINDILDMSRIESGKVELDEKPIDLKRAGDKCLLMCNTLAEGKGIVFEYLVGRIVDRYVYADELRLNQIIINVVSNAIKYTDSGGHVSLSVNQTGEYRNGCGVYRFVIEDTGEGMSEEFLGHLFEAFSRERNTTISKKQGTGLGLTITKRLVDFMGGSIEVDSKINCGTRFAITIPLRIQENPEESMGEYEATPVRLDLEGKRILLAEDNEFNREIAIELLEDEGMVVEYAVDGLEAVKKIEEHGSEYYDAVLMDIQMPNLDGYGATRKIRAMYPNRHIPIIALSANAFEEDKAKSREAGLDDHLSKPIVMEALYSTLSKTINNSRS